jgi:hypothetical protein
MMFDMRRNRKRSAGTKLEPLKCTRYVAPRNKPPQF